MTEELDEPSKSKAKRPQVAVFPGAMEIGAKRWAGECFARLEKAALQRVGPGGRPNGALQLDWRTLQSAIQALFAATPNADERVRAECRTRSGYRLAWVAHLPDPQARNGWLSLMRIAQLRSPGPPFAVLVRPEQHRLLQQLQSIGMIPYAPTEAGGAPLGRTQALIIAAEQQHPEGDLAMLFLRLDPTVHAAVQLRS